MGDQIKADYQALQQIIQQLTTLEDKARDTRSKILAAYDEVKDQWSGKGSEAFKGEMDGQTLTRLTALEYSFGHVRNAIEDISKKFHETEDTIKKRDATFGGGSSGGGGSATPDPWAGGSPSP